VSRVALALGAIVLVAGCGCSARHESAHASPHRLSKAEYRSRAVPDIERTEDGVFRAVFHVPEGAVVEERELRREAARLEAMTPPLAIVRVHARMIHAFRTLADELGELATLARTGHADALGAYLHRHGRLHGFDSMLRSDAQLRDRGYIVPEY
jgi:hypothetical protein